MKKQIKKLSLNKRTISNLTTEEMNKHVGGGTTGSTIESCTCPGRTKNCTQNQNTCPGHNTCYYC
ncbi:MAG TPA: class I lanthipeptide [Chitinophagaceae bacterium]|nr:class I lanthipeptide [Chitinophagaceae bacterium]